MDLDDDFLDDGFDDVTDTVLEELERQAIQLTQHQPSLAQQAEDDFDWADDDDDLDTTEVINEAGPPPARPLPVGKSIPQQSAGANTFNSNVGARVGSRPPPPAPNPRWNPAIDPANRPPVASGLNGNRPQPSQFARPPIPANRFAPSQASQVALRLTQGAPGDIVAALQNRVRLLEGELNEARGEISIIRSNSTRAQQQHDAEVDRLRRVHAENQAKQGRLVEAAVAAEKNASTELQFLKRDVREVNDRTRRRENSGNGVGPGGNGAPVTPSKTHKTWGVADGFDDLDMAASPSKGRSKPVGSVALNMGERTPNRGKRKRTQIDSPVMSLEISAGEDVKMVDRTVPRPPPPIVIAPPALPFEFLQLVLDHNSGPTEPPTFELFSRFSFPSEPEVSFSAMIFGKLPLMGNPGRPMQLLVDFAEFMVFLWTRCLDEEFWEPIKHIVSLIFFTFQLNTSSVAPLIVLSLAAAARRSIYMLAEARHRLPDGDLTKDGRYKNWQEQIDTTYILLLLYASGLSCATTTVETDIGTFESKAVDFWRLLPLDFVLLLLTPKQKLTDVLGMLNLLVTSSLPDSLGPITDDKDPPFIARIIIERVSAKLLNEKSPVPLSTAEKLEVKLTTLQTLIAFARHDFGALQLATHGNALPRLVACLSASIDELYDQPAVLPPLDFLREGESSAELHSVPASTPFQVLNQIITLSVQLVHTLVTGPKTADVAEISQKLATSHGGSQRYLIALGRLTFAEEDLVLEAGIESEVVEMANELLEMAVTPDEGEIIGEAFGA